MKRIAEILLRPVIPDRYIRVWCLLAGVAMMIAGVVLIFSGYHGLMFLLMGSVCVVSTPRRKNTKG